MVATEPSHQVILGGGMSLIYTDTVKAALTVGLQYKLLEPVEWMRMFCYTRRILQPMYNLMITLFSFHGQPFMIMTNDNYMVIT